MKRTFLYRALILTVAALLLGGCFKADMNIAVEENGDSTMTLTYGISKQTLEMFGMTGDDALEESEGFEENEFPEGATVETEPYETDTHIGETVTVSNITVDELVESFEVDNEETDTFVLELGDPISTFEMVIEPDEELAGGEDAMFTPQIEMNVAVEMPGGVTAHNGTRVEGSKVFWDELDMTDTIDLSATWDRNENNGESSTDYLPIVGIVLVLAAIAATFAVVSSRKRNRSVEEQQ